MVVLKIDTSNFVNKVAYVNSNLCCCVCNVIEIDREVLGVTFAGTFALILPTNNPGWSHGTVFIGRSDFMLVRMSFWCTLISEHFNH